MNKIKCPFNDCNSLFTLNIENVLSKEYEKNCPGCKRPVKIYALASKEIQDKIDAKEKGFIKERKELENSFGYILVEKSDHSLEKFELAKKKVEIGRKDPSSSADLQIPTDDLTMSRMHFFLEYVHAPVPFFKLSKSKDLNGTYVETKNHLSKVKELRKMEPMEVARLEDEEVIIAGNTKIVVKVDTSSSKEVFRRFKEIGLPPTMITG